MSHAPSELPIAIECRWFVTYTRNPFDDHDDYVNVITWADGSTEERFTIPREWHHIAIATHQRAIDAGLAQMAMEHREGRVGNTPVKAREAAFDALVDALCNAEAYIETINPSAPQLATIRAALSRAGVTS